MDFSVKTGEDLIMIFLLMAFAAMAVILLVVIFKILFFVRKLNDERLGIEREPFSIKKYFTKSTFSTSIQQEETILLDHSYDGIKELDNHLPPWWLGMFYGGIVFGIVYLLNYHVWKWAPLQGEEYENDMAMAAEEVKAYKATLAMSIDESNVTLVSDATALASGKEIYTAKCVACHGALGEGGVGPNLTDNYWLHGGTVSEVFSTIKYGVASKGMIAWESQLKPDEMQNLTSFILTLQGTNPPNAKEAQGELIEPKKEIEIEKKEVVAQLNEPK